MSIAAGLALLWAWALGAFVVANAWPRTRRWRDDAALLLPLALLVGLATTSVTHFFASMAFIRPALVAGLFEVVVAGILGWRLRWRARIIEPQLTASAAPAWTWPQRLLAGVFALAAGAALVGTVRSYHVEPYGGWDAWAIWNLHARLMLRAGPEWVALLRAPPLSWTHPDYPPLVSASVARAWAWTGAEPPFAGALVSVAFGAALLALLIAALALVRGRTVALLGGLLLVSTPFFVTFSPNQHADIPLAAFMLAALALTTTSGSGAAGGAMFLAGLCAGFAAWTKNEGLLFAPVFVGVVSIAAFRRGEARTLPPLLVGLALALVPVAVFKIALAPPNDLLAAPADGRFAKMEDLHRHALILHALWRDARAFGEWSLAPYLAMALPFFAWRARRRFAARERIVPAVLLLMLAGYYAIYLVTPQDLEWHLDSSLVRLLLQLWPLALLAWGFTAPAVAAEAPARETSRAARFAFAALVVAGIAAVMGWLPGPAPMDELAWRSRGGAQLVATPGRGWFGVERLDNSAWSWAGGNATLDLHARSTRPAETIALHFSLRSLAPRRVAIRLGSRVLWEGSVSEREFVPVEIPALALTPGITVLDFITDAPPTPEASDPGARSLAFAIYDLTIR